MSTSRLLLPILLLGCASIAAQQPNTPQASMTINCLVGPPYPLIGAFLYGGTVSLLEVSGAPNAPLLVAVSPQLTVLATPIPGGIVDIDISDPGAVGMLLDGFVSAPGQHVTGPSGLFVEDFPVAQTVTVNTSAALQGAVSDPSSPAGYSLTAATSVLETSLRALGARCPGVCGQDVRAPKTRPLGAQASCLQTVKLPASAARWGHR